MVYVGPFETEDSCDQWKNEYELTFPVVPDHDGALFRELTSGWVPWSILLGSDGSVLFSENEFDEAGFSAAIVQLLGVETAHARAAKPESAESVARTQRPAGPSTIVVLGGGVGGVVAARKLRKLIGAEHQSSLSIAPPITCFSPPCFGSW